MKQKWRMALRLSALRAPLLLVLIAVSCLSRGVLHSAKASGSTTTIISSTDLSTAFHTKGTWYLNIARGPDFPPPYWPKTGPISLCFEHNSDTICVQNKIGVLYGQTAILTTDLRGLPSFLAYPNGISIVAPDKVLPFPLLVVRLEEMNPGPGGQGGPFVFIYQPKSDSFKLIFQAATAHNLNQEIRVVQGGPLSGDIIESGACDSLTCHYPIQVYRLTHDARYIRVLEFRGESRYDDGDSRDVIDADMPEIFKRMHVN